MKTAISLVMMLSMTVVFGCSSPRGGGAAGGEGFRIRVPAGSTSLKQGDRRTVDISLRRGDHFKRDVTLEIRASTGISVEPTEVVVRAADTPEVQLQIEAPEDAAIGEYRVFVKGTPETGQETSTDFKVKVVAP